MVKTPVLYKSLVVGVILLFIISTIGPVVIGYNVKSDIVIHESSSDISPFIRWTKRFGGEDAPEDFESVRQTSDNGYILCGHSCYYSPFGWIDAWLVKTDENGEMIWAESYGIYHPDGLDHAWSVEQTTDGGYIFSGYNAEEGGWLCKIDNIGGVEWSKTFYYADRLFSVQQAPDGGYITAGDYSILIKTYPNGTEQWWRKLSISGHSTAMDVDVTDDNGFIITGYFSQEDYRAIFLIKVDSNGVEEFKKTFVWEGYNIRAESVEQTSDGGYAIVGTAYSINTPVVLIKTDSEGNEMWNRTYHNPFSDDWRGEEFQQTDDGGYIIIARENDYYVCSWLIKTDANGNVEWDTILGGFEYTDVGFVSVQQTTDGGYILGGDANEINSHYDDYYLMKIDMIDDTPPKKPELDGPSYGRIYAKHTFTTSTTDPDGDDVYYIFDWSDNSNSEWLGPYKSGEEITASHRWTTFELHDSLIRVRAKDIHGVMSEWSDPIEFTVPRNRIINNLWLLRLLERIPVLEILFNEIV